ncbi:MAG TPA: hypothetical protein VGG39_26785 [Polyangiaceae bacterium]
MPRDRRAFEDATRTHAVRDAALDRASGGDVDEDGEDAAEWTDAAVSERLREEWRCWKLAKRQAALRAAIAVKFRRRFGLAWNAGRAALFAEPPWPPARGLGRASRSVAPRSRLVVMLDFENQLGLPPRPDGSARFLSVLELTWISLLAGHWPDAARWRLPGKVLRCERESIKKALRRHGQKPAEALGITRIRRGPQVRARPR